MGPFKRVVRDGDIVSGVVLASLGTYILVTASRWDYLTPNGPGPGFFPVWYGLLMIVLSLALVASRIVSKSKDELDPIDWPGLLRAFGTWLLFVVGAAVMPWLGFVTAFTIVCFSLIFLVFRRPLSQSLIAAIAITAVFHVIFVILLQLDLPVGPLGI